MSDTAEKQVLSEIADKLQSEGYDVFSAPSAQVLPDFLRDLRPDAVALKGGQNQVVEIVRQGPRAQERIDVLTKAVAGHDEWSLRVIWMSPLSTSSDPSVQAPQEVAGRISQVRALAESSPEAALLVAWAAFEALARRMLPASFSRPQTPGRLIEVLAGEGDILPSEADFLRRMAQLRNAFIHGQLDVRVSPSDVRHFAEILDLLRAQIAV